MCECFAKWFDRLELTFASTAQPPAAACIAGPSWPGGRSRPGAGRSGHRGHGRRSAVVMATRFAVDFGYGRRSCAARSRAPDGAHLQSGPGVLRGPRRDEAPPGPLYLSVGDGIVRALRERPCMLHRFPSGVAGPKVHQKRVPGGAPGWLETVRVDFPRYGGMPTSCALPNSPASVGGPDVHRGIPSVEQPAGRHREAGRVAHRPGSDA